MATVTVWDHNGNGRTTRRACEIIGRRPAPRSFVEAGKAADWFDVRTRDGVVYRNCNPACARV